VTAMGWAWSLWLLRPVHRALCGRTSGEKFYRGIAFRFRRGESGSAGLARNSGGTQCLGSRKASVSHGKAAAYLPVLELLHAYFKIVAEDDPRTRREKIAGRITILDHASKDALIYLFSLLGIAFRRKIYSGIEQLQADLDAWLREYNQLRPHQGRWCYGKTPMQTSATACHWRRRRCSARPQHPRRPRVWDYEWLRSAAVAQATA
jgi:hypothetical protein